MLIKWRLGKGVPHPWWHCFFTEWKQDINDYIAGHTRIHYRCSWCKKEYVVTRTFEELEGPAYPVVEVSSAACDLTKGDKS